MRNKKKIGGEGYQCLLKSPGTALLHYQLALTDDYIVSKLHFDCCINVQEI